MSIDGGEALAPPLRVGVDSAPPPPMCFGVPGSPEFRGFEVDLVNTLAARLQRPLHCEASLWVDLLERLTSGDLDVVCTAATITPERERRFRFSRPYLRTQLALMCRRDRPVSTLSGFAGRLGVRPGTPAEAYGVSHAPALSRFHFNTEVYQALEERSIDAVVDDLPIGAWFAAQSPMLRVGAPLDGTDAVYALVLSKEAAALKLAVDAALGAMFDDGTYARLYDAWLTAVVGDACDVTKTQEGRVTS